MQKSDVSYTLRRHGEYLVEDNTKGNVSPATESIALSHVWGTVFDSTENMRAISIGLEIFLDDTAYHLIDWS